MRRTELNIDIQNNTSGVVPMNILGGFIFNNDISNQNVSYVYNITGLSFAGENMVSILYRSVGASSYTLYNAPLQEQSISGILQALNLLGVGSFFTYQSGANTYIATYTNNFEFSVLDVYDNSTSPINVYWFNNTFIAVSGSLVIDVNTVNQVTSPNGSFGSGVIATANGDVVDVTASLDISEADTPLTIYYQTNVPSPPTVIVYSGNVVSGGSVSTSFTVASGRTYYIEYGIIP